MLNSVKNKLLLTVLTTELTLRNEQDDNKKEGKFFYYILLNSHVILSFQAMHLLPRCDPLIKINLA